MSAVVQKTKEHIDNMLHPKRMWVILSGAVLLISLIAAFMQPYRRSIVLWFPEIKTGMLKAEMRLIPWHSGKVVAVSAIVEELLLGPANPKLKPFTDQRAKLKEVIQSKNEFIIALDAKALFVSSVKPELSDYSKFFTAIAKSVRFNTGIKHLAIAIEGYIVFLQ